MARKNFTPATIKMRLQHAGYQCEALMADGTRCLVKAERGKFHCDHDNPDGLTGEPTFENARILCLGHHAEKTARDVEAIARAKRVEAKHIGTKASGKTALAGRPDEVKKLAKAPKRPPVERKRGLYEDVVVERNSA